MNNGLRLYFMKALVIVSVLGLISFIAMAKETHGPETRLVAPSVVKPVGPNIEPIKFIPGLTPGK